MWELEFYQAKKLGSNGGIYTVTTKCLYITDLDGTLLNGNKEVNKFAEDKLNALIVKGMNFSVATARTGVSTTKIMSGININVPIVLMNGVLVYDIKENKFIKTEGISEGMVNAILEIFSKHAATGFMYTISNNNMVTYYENLDTKAMKNFHDERVIKYNKLFVQVDSLSNEINKNNVVYFCLTDVYEQLAKVYNALRNLDDIDCVLYRNIYSESLWYLEVHSKKASKYNAVKYLRDYCKFDKIIGFGDNLNDIPLFKACDECYAVSNAVDELKEIATGVIGDNISDAVVKFICEREGLTNY